MISGFEDLSKPPASDTNSGQTPEFLNYFSNMQSGTLIASFASMAVALA